MLALPGMLPELAREERVAAQGLAPYFVEEARGGRFTSVEGRTYIDYVMGWGAFLFGYQYEPVLEAVAEQLRRGVGYSLAAELQVETAERFIEQIPCAEQVYFGKNGSDACTTAVRIACQATEREEIALCQGHYHGFHDWFACTIPWIQGFPSSLRERLHEFAFNDVESVERLFEAHGSRLAAVILEPAREQEPAGGFLERLTELAHAHGTLVIFDEMVTGLRLAAGGAQEHYGVVPDLSCFGKSVANGLPLSFTAGPRGLMQLAPQVQTRMTFQHEQLSLAAAGVVGESVREPGIHHRLWDFGRRLRIGVEAAAAAHRVEVHVMGPAVRSSLYFPPQEGVDSGILLRYFIERLLHGGVYTNGNFLPSFAHTDSDLRDTLRAARRAFADIAEALSAGDLEKRLQLPHGIA